MNREIKFRVWDRALNKMITQENVKGLLDTVNTGDYYTDYTYSGEEWYPAYDILTIFDYFEDIEDRYIEDTSTKRFELMQYTGLHDKNGKEIYEGDIVKITNKNSKVIPIKPLIAQIVWSEEYLAYILITTSVKDAFENLGDYIDYDIEVIGNVFENPKLLGGEWL